MKYRLLSDDELEHFQDELKQFLIVNGVHAEEWEKMNLEEPQKAVELIGPFSDTVLQRVYEKLRYFEFRSTNSLMLFYVGTDIIHLISVSPKPGENVDLSTVESIHTALSNQAGLLNYFKTSKSIQGEREMEVHRLLNQGCVVSSEEFWEKMIETLNPENIEHISVIKH